MSLWLVPHPAGRPANVIHKEFLEKIANRWKIPASDLPYIIEACVAHTPAPDRPMQFRQMHKRRIILNQAPESKTKNEKPSISRVIKSSQGFSGINFCTRHRLCSLRDLMFNRISALLTSTLNS